MFEATGCDAVMIGRAALGNPWVFSACRAWWTGEEPPAPPSPVDRLDLYLRHLHLYLQIADDGKVLTGIFEAGFIEANPVAFTQAAVSKKEARGEMSAEDQKKVLERLRSLGYID